MTITELLDAIADLKIGGATTDPADCLREYLRLTSLHKYRWTIYMRKRWEAIHEHAGDYVSRRIIAQEIADGEGLK